MVPEMPRQNELTGSDHIAVSFIVNFGDSGGSFSFDRNEKTGNPFT